MLGESCPFDHGMDPLVVGPMMQWPLGGAQMGPAGVPPLGGCDWGNGWLCGRAVGSRLGPMCVL